MKPGWLVMINGVLFTDGTRCRFLAINPFPQAIPTIHVSEPSTKAPRSRPAGSIPAANSEQMPKIGRVPKRLAGNGENPGFRCPSVESLRQSDKRSGIEMVGKRRELWRAGQMSVTRPVIHKLPARRHRSQRLPARDKALIQ